MLAFDLGASSGRAILGRFDGKRITLEEVHKFPNGPELIDGHLYWDALGIFRELLTGLKKAYTISPNLTSIGVDTWGVDYGLLDKNGDLLSNPFHYRDERTNGLLQEIFSQISEEELYGKTGIQALSINTLVQLFADKKYRPWILENAETLLFMPSLLTFWFTGEKVNEQTIASTSQMLKAGSLEWAEDVLHTLDMPKNLIGKLISPGAAIGKLRKDLAQQWGLPQLDVVAVGSHDTASAVLATPITEPGSVYISCGTWSLVGVELDSPILTTEANKAGFTNEMGWDGTVRFLKNITGLWMIQQCKASWEREGMNLSYAKIANEAAKARPNLFKLDPNDPRFNNPLDMPQAIREYCQEANQPMPETIGEMARGIYESLAYSHHETITQLEKLTGREVPTIHIVGGGSQAELLCQLTADITGKRVVAGPVEATALGNLLGQMWPKGVIRSRQEAREIARASVDLKEYLPKH